MRSTKPRSRNKSNRNRNNNSSNNINRVFDSSGPEGRVRGTPQQIIEKYAQLARDAFLSNDRVAGENFQQHAEHYTRMLGEAQREIEARRLQAEQQNRDRQQREREERDARAERQAAAAPASSETRAPAVQAIAGEGEQPDIADAPQPDVMTRDDDNGLVDTPESKPKKPRARKPRASKKVDAPSASEPGNGDAPEAAE